MICILDITIEEINILLNQLELMSKSYVLEDNIHMHSSFLGEKCKEFLALDNKYGMSGNNTEINAQNIYELIITFSKNDPVIIEILQSIKNFGTNIEQETGLNIEELLIRSWRLSDHCFASANMKELIVDNLKHNKATGGGCLAGIAARLTQPYCCGIGFILETIKDQKQLTQSFGILEESETENNSPVKKCRYTI
jgi:hypothetical protein